MIERLIFGTARLAAGASERESRAVLDAVLQAGVRHIDTAPSYGMGTAELVVGRVLRDFGEAVLVTAKLGSSRDRFGLAKTWLRRAKRAIMGSGRSPFTPVRDHPAIDLALFEANAMRRSLDVAIERLGRIDWLLLHDFPPGKLDAARIGELQERAAGIGALAGYSQSAMFDPADDHAAPPHWIAQTAIDPQWLNGSATMPDRPGTTALHSIVFSTAWLVETEPRFAAAFAQASAMVGQFPRSAKAATGLCLAASRCPDARLIFAANEPERARDLMACLKHIEAQGLAPQIVACFG